MIVLRVRGKRATEPNARAPLVSLRVSYGSLGATHVAARDDKGEIRRRQRRSRARQDGSRRRQTRIVENKTDARRTNRNFVGRQSAFEGNKVSPKRP